MVDEKLARIRTHRNNIDRYNRLLKTNVSDFERQFIERRLNEEASSLAKLAESTFPIIFEYPKPLPPAAP